MGDEHNNTEAEANVSNDSSNNVLTTDTATMASGSNTTLASDDSAQPKLSKKQQRKLKRQQIFAEKNAFQKKKKKEKHKEEVERRRKARLEENRTEEEIAQKKAETKLLIEKRRREKEEQTRRLEHANQHPELYPIVCVDCNFNHLMHESEIKSMAQQLAYCYASNSRAEKPVHLSFTSLGGKLLERMHAHSGFTSWKVRSNAEHFSKLYAQDKTVYLTADSDTILESLEPGYTYCIGGIVDRNRYKGLCFKEAEKYGVKTAKFPLKDFVSLNTSSVLTVNQCLDILLKFNQTKSWREAVLSVVPQRKQAKEGDGQEAKKKAKNSTAAAAATTANADEAQDANNNNNSDKSSNNNYNSPTAAGQQQDNEASKHAS